MMPPLVLLLSFLLALLTALVLGEDAAWAEPDTPAHVSGRVTDVLGKPVPGAHVYVVSSAEGVEQTLTTDAQGRYDAELRGTGTYTVVLSFKDKRTGKQVTIAPGEQHTIDAQLDVALEGEVIEIKEFHPPPVVPKPTFDIQRAPPYSARAITSDTWTKAWLLLDVDERGAVKRFKFLKRPGFDLEEIAAKQAFQMTFTPARDTNNKPVSTYVVWGMEWPSYWWLLERTRTANRIPPLRSGIPGQASLASVPCALGEKNPLSSSLIWDSIYKTYRDCSRPDLKRAAIEPWITRS